MNRTRQKEAGDTVAFTECGFIKHQTNFLSKTLLCILENSGYDESMYLLIEIKLRSPRLL